MPRDIIPYNVSRDKEGAKSNIDLHRFVSGNNLYKIEKNAIKLTRYFINIRIPHDFKGKILSL